MKAELEPLEKAHIFHGAPAYRFIADLNKQKKGGHVSDLAEREDGNAVINNNVLVTCNESFAEKWRKVHNVTDSPVKSQEQRKIFLEFAEIMDTARVPFYIARGTLLAFWRECDFMPHDVDLDVGVMHRHYDFSLKQTFIDAGFGILREFGDPSVELYEYTIFKLGPSGQRYHIDIFHAEEGESTITEALWLFDADKGYNTPLRCSYPFKQFAVAKWFGRYFWVPYPVYDFLAPSYDPGKTGEWVRARGGSNSNCGGGRHEAQFWRTQRSSFGKMKPAKEAWQKIKAKGQYTVVSTEGPGMAESLEVHRHRKLSPVIE